VCVQRLVRQAARTVAIKVPSSAESSAEKVHCAQCPRECGSRVAPYLEELCVSR
jgi:hypothetical protein